MVTGRSLFPQEVEAFFDGYSNVRGAKFCSMSLTLQTDWINKWSSVLANDTLANDFRDFLENCPTDIRDELASQPLSLYLLAQLVQSQKISSIDFIKTKNVYARSLIYQRSLDVTLETAIKSKSFKSLEKQVDLNKDKLKSILSDVAFCFVTSNYKPISISNIKSTLQSSRIIPDVDLSSKHINLNLERLLSIVLEPIRKPMLFGR
ncbi:MAG: hypothetical protein ACTS2F_31290 [Thainema sp.]